MTLNPRTGLDAPDAYWRRGEFFKHLSCAAMKEFESLAAPFSRRGNTVLFTQEQEASSVLFLFEGSVKLSLNSNTGGRLIIGFARPGEFLGLTSAVSGLPYEMTAETQFPCTITSIERQSFLDFLLHYPVACL